MKRTPLNRRKPLEPGSASVRRSRIPRRSVKTEARYVERRALVAEMLAPGTLCAFVIEGVCTGLAVDVDEIKPRSAGGSILDRENCAPVCRACHDWKHQHPAEAAALGLRKWSWDA